jgi:hypothetical protein
MLDHTEPTTVTEGQPALFSFDAVEADGFDTLRGFSSENSVDCDLTWKNYWGSGRQGSRNSPFNYMDVFRVDVVLEPSDPMFWTAVKVQKPEDHGISGALRPTWVLFEMVPDGQGVPAELYPSMFGDPVSVNFQIKLPTPSRAANLDRSFSLRNLPRVTASDVATMLSAGNASALCVYDVGQGSACALTDPS